MLSQNKKWFLLLVLALFLVVVGGWSEELRAGFVVEFFLLASCENSIQVFVEPSERRNYDRRIIHSWCSSRNVMLSLTSFNRGSNPT